MEIPSNAYSAEAFFAVISRELPTCYEAWFNDCFALIHQTFGQELENMETRDRVLLIHRLTGKLLQKFKITEPTVQETLSHDDFLERLTQEGIPFLREGNGFLWHLVIDTLTHELFCRSDRAGLLGSLETFLQGGRVHKYFAKELLFDLLIALEKEYGHRLEKLSEGQRMFLAFHLSVQSLLENAYGHRYLPPVPARRLMGILEREFPDLPLFQAEGGAESKIDQIADISDRLIDNSMGNERLRLVQTLVKFMLEPFPFDDDFEY